MAVIMGGMTTSTLTEALSAQERYTRELDRLLAQVDRLDARAVRRALALLTEARRRILATLAEVPEESYLASYLPRLQAEVEQAMNRYVTRYSQFFDEQASQFWDLGVASVDAPLRAAGATPLVVQIPSLEPRYLDILQGFRASLITDVSQQAITRITAELQLGVLGGKTPFEIQRSVASILSTQPNAAGSFHGVAARAEAITRTELNRTFSLATQSRQSQMNERVTAIFPELVVKKMWVATQDDRTRPSHRRMHGQTVPLNNDFTLIGADGVTYKAKHPHDARLPASEATNCRCRSVVDAASIMRVLEPS